MLSIEIQDTINVTVHPKFLNIHNSQVILQQLKEIAATHEKGITLDMANVDSVDSSTIAMLVEFNSIIKDGRGQLTIVNLTPFVRKVFDMLHITKFFNIR